MKGTPEQRFDRLRGALMEVARAVRWVCYRCWDQSFGYIQSERDTYRRSCLASAWLVFDCYRPDRR